MVVEVKRKAKEIIKGNWLDVMIVIFIFGVIKSLLGLVLMGSGFIGNMIRSFQLMEQGNIEAALLSMAGIGASSIILGIVNSTVQHFFSGVLLMTIYDYIKTNDRPSVSKAFNIISEGFVEIGLLSLLLASIMTIVGILPIIGFIIALVLSYAFFPAYLLMMETDRNSVDSLTDSLQATKGHKLSIFLIKFLYGIKPFALALVVGLLAAVLPKGFLTVVIIGLGFIVVGAYRIYLMPLIPTATAYYYYKYISEDGEPDYDDDGRDDIGYEYHYEK